MNKEPLTHLVVNQVGDNVWWAELRNEKSDEDSVFSLGFSRKAVRVRAGGKTGVDILRKNMGRIAKDRGISLDKIGGLSTAIAMI